MKKNIAIIENNILATNTIRGKLTRTLIDKGYNVTVLTTGTAAELELARAKGFHVIDVKASNQSPRDIGRYVLNLRKALKKMRPDVVLTFTIRPAIWGNIVTRQLGIPTITNITGIGPLFESNDITYRAARSLYKGVLKKTAKIFFQNHDDMNLFLDKKFVKPERAERIPGSGVDHEYYKPLKKVKESGRFSFLFISRLIKDKGILEYVAAARMLKKEMPDVSFDVLGPYWSQNLKDNIITKEDVAQWVAEGIIEYKGGADDVREYIAGADCIVLPSYREGTSNVLLEAASMEKPAITCDTTGCNEIVEDGVTGYLVEVKSANDLADKMRMMYKLSHEEREQMGIKARQRVIKNFDKQIVIDAYLRAIEAVIEEQPAL
jgi:glycosyltransferase involved in cell wall biosynthesis